MSRPSPVLPGGDAELLIAALSRDPAAWKELTVRFRQLLRAAVRHRAPDMPPDLVDEVIQEIWLALNSRTPEEFRQALQSPEIFLTSFVRDAIKRVRAAYRAPGTRARSPDTFRGPAAEDEGVIAVARDPLWERSVASTDARIDIERVARRATPRVARAIAYVQDADASVDQAAIQVNMPRSTLQRHLRKLGAINGPPPCIVDPVLAQQAAA